MELKYRKPLNSSKTVSVGAGASATLVIDKASDVLQFLKSLTITKGGNTSITSIKIDGEDIGLKTSFDSETEFGSLVYAEKVEVVASNAGVAAEDLTVTIKGIKSK